LFIIKPPPNLPPKGRLKKSKVLNFVYLVILLFVKIAMSLKFHLVLFTILQFTINLKLSWTPFLSPLFLGGDLGEAL